MRFDLILNTVTLWAMWENKGPSDLGNLGSLSGFKCSQIKNLRDYGKIDNSYFVVKMLDGNCWITNGLGVYEYRGQPNISCPSGWSVPSETSYNNLISVYSSKGVKLFDDWRYSGSFAASTGYSFYYNDIFTINANTASVSQTYTYSHSFTISCFKSV